MYISLEIQIHYSHFKCSDTMQLIIVVLYYIPLVFTLLDVYDGSGACTTNIKLRFQSFISYFPSTTFLYYHSYSFLPFLFFLTFPLLSYISSTSLPFLFSLTFPLLSYLSPSFFYLSSTFLHFLYFLTFPLFPYLSSSVLSFPFFLTFPLLSYLSSTFFFSNFIHIIVIFTSQSKQYKYL